MKIAIPSSAPGGLDSPHAVHFGHAEAFTLVEVSEQGVTQVQVLPNQAHAQGGCTAVVSLLKNAGVQALLAGGMGARPLAGFQQVGIEVYFSQGAPTVGEALRLLTEGSAPRFGPSQTCQGGEGDCAGH